jgi:hypothetical protein
MWQTNQPELILTNFNRKLLSLPQPDRLPNNIPAVLEVEDAMIWDIQAISIHCKRNRTRV